jgi:hypothetical protein
MLIQKLASWRSAPGPGRHVKTVQPRHARRARLPNRRPNITDAITAFTGVALLILAVVQVVLMVVQVANPPRPSVVYNYNITVNVSAGGHVNAVGGDEAGDG